MKKTIKEEVAEWFERAKKNRCGINLWYSPLNKEFFRVATPIEVKGVKTDLLEYKGHLFQVRSGSGDCEENLWHVGKCEE